MTNAAGRWRVWARWAPAALGVIAIAALLDVIPRPHLLQPARGWIYVDSPEVYTRERLVNDRYEHDEWLREELKKTSTLEAGTQGSYFRDERRWTSVAAAVGSAAPSAGEVPDGGAPPDKSAGSKASLIDDFHDRASYRDEIRAELIENQLDDRHDLGGNTVYRVKFDAAVVPVAKNEASAVIEVRMLKIAGETARNELRGEAGRDLYWTWLSQTLTEMQTLLDKRLEDAWRELSATAVALTRKVAAPPFSDQVSDDLKRTQALVRRVSEKAAKACAPEATDLAVDLQCLLLASDEKKRGAKAQLRTFFTQYFSDYASERYGALADFGWDGDQLSLDVFELRKRNQRQRTKLEAKFESGFSAFQEVLNPEASEVYTYAVAPKESADRLAAQAVLGDFVGLGVAAAAPIGTVSGSAAVSDRRQREVYAGMIARTPRVVGFSNDIDWGASFGWVIGPRFAMPEKVQAAGHFEQQTAHYSLSAIVSAPSWWTRQPTQILVYWLDPVTGTCSDEHGVAFTPCPPNGPWKSLTRLVRQLYVKLPGDSRILGQVVARQLQKSGILVDELQPPTIAKADMEIVNVEVGATAHIVIPGQSLWRSPVVTLGSQQAKRIKVLPNMNGLIATFEPVEAPAGWDGNEPYKEARVTVWTSQKQPDSVTGKVWIHPAKATQRTAAANVAAPGAAPTSAPPVVSVAVTPVVSK